MSSATIPYTFDMQDIYEILVLASPNTPGLQYTFVGGVLDIPSCSQADLDTAVLEYAKRKRISDMNSMCEKSIMHGFSTSINGNQRMITLSHLDQRNAMMASITAQAIMTDSKAWSANKPVTVNDTCVINGQYYVCVGSGTTGQNIPIMPTKFEQHVIDGTASWALFGIPIGTDAGNEWCDAATIYSLFAQGVSYVTGCRAKYMALKNQINAATAVADVQAITW